MLTRRAFLSFLPQAVLFFASRSRADIVSMPAQLVPVAEIAGIIRKKSLFAGEDWDESALMEAARNGSMTEVRECLRAFDKYASYTPAEEFAALKKLRQALPAGVGMDIFEDRQRRVRCVPYPGSPSQKAGVLYGDVLKGVDGTAIRGKELFQIARQIRGQEGSVASLCLYSEGGTMRTAVMPRTSATYPTVSRTRISPAVIRIFRFSRQTPVELHACLQNLADDEGCVIDLRGNTGGSMEAGVECARMFLKKGDILLRLCNRNSLKDMLAAANGQYHALPVVLLQDQFTASAAELFIAALACAGRARTKGSQSAGKACVQNIFTLSDGSVLKLTTEKMLYPGRTDDWEGAGIPPGPAPDDSSKGDIHVQ